MVPPSEAVLSSGSLRIPSAPPRRVWVPGKVWPPVAIPGQRPLPPEALPGLHPDAAEFVSRFVDPAAPAVRIVNASAEAQLTAMPDSGAAVLVNTAPLNNVRFLNQLFRAAHAALPAGGVLVVTLETLAQRRRRIFGKLPAGVAHLYDAATFMLRRVLPKLPATRGAYYALTGGRRQILSEAEALGRLVYCGFEIEDTREVDGRMYVAARRTGTPVQGVRPSTGPLFAMRRVGLGGRLIHVLKVRTMHPYAEFLQEYVYRTNSLAEGGKFRDDFRITAWARPLRRLWIDELPMLVNWLRRDLKLVGVRPLSVHYESLYPQELRELRRSVRPGLVPPFYADLPTTFEEILRSEREYIEAYQRRPLRTDLRYLVRALRNIVLKGSRSG